MLMIERRPRSLADAGTDLPRIQPVHQRVDRRHPDLSFSINTAGRPYFRVLLAKQPGLFLAAAQRDRNTGNFYDSITEGLLPFDGVPGFYLLPRAALTALLPASALYFTLVAYDDRDASRAAYAHTPEMLAQAAPSVVIDADLKAGSFGAMFGTPVARLFTVGMAQAASAEEDLGEDQSSDDAEMALAIDPDADLDQAQSLAEYDAVEEAADAASLGHDDGYNDGYEHGQDEEPGFSEAEALDEAPFRYTAEDSAAPQPEAGSSDGLSASAYDDGFDDGFDDAAEAQGSYGHRDALLLGNEPDYAVPDLLPDEDADPADAAPSGAATHPDAVHIAAAAGVDEDDYTSAYGEAASVVKAAPRQPFDIEACKAVLARIMPFESGNEAYARVEPDGEFNGRYGSQHPAYKRFHLGLSYGAFPFVQEQGTLGQLLALMQQRDGAAFGRIFGADAATLLAVTTDTRGPQAWDSADGLSPRLQPVGGALLWQEPWLARFREAGRQPRFQGAQNELASRLYVQPMMSLATRLGLDSAQALTLLVDRAVQMGTAAAQRWVLDAVSPVQSLAQRQQALSRLGHGDLRAFQQAQGLPAQGEWDSATHIELLGALRAHSDSPLPMPTREQMVAAMARRAEGTPWAERLSRLRAATSAELLFQL